MNNLDCIFILKKSELKSEEIFPDYACMRVTLLKHQNEKLAVSFIMSIVPCFVEVGGGAIVHGLMKTFLLMKTDSAGNDRQLCNEINIKKLIKKKAYLDFMGNPS